MPEKPYHAREKTKCKVPDCPTLTASKVGFCSRHFYMSKSPKAQETPGKHHDWKTIRHKSEAKAERVQRTEAEFLNLCRLLRAPKKGAGISRSSDCR